MDRRISTDVPDDGLTGRADFLDRFPPLPKVPVSSLLASSAQPFPDLPERILLHDLAVPRGIEVPRAHLDPVTRCRGNNTGNFLVIFNLTQMPYGVNICVSS